MAGRARRGGICLFWLPRRSAHLFGVCLWENNEADDETQKHRNTEIQKHDLSQRPVMDFAERCFADRFEDLRSHVNGRVDVLDDEAGSSGSDVAM